FAFYLSSPGLYFRHHAERVAQRCDANRRQAGNRRPDRQPKTVGPCPDGKTRRAIGGATEGRKRNRGCHFGRGRSRNWCAGLRIPSRLFVRTSGLRGGGPIPFDGGL